MPSKKPTSSKNWGQQLNTYHAARHQIRLDPEARNARHTHLSEDGLTIHWLFPPAVFALLLAVPEKIGSR